MANPLVAVCHERTASRPSLLFTRAVPFGDSKCLAIEMAEALKDSWDDDRRFLLYIMVRSRDGARFPVRITKFWQDACLASGWEPRILYRVVDLDTPNTDAEKHPSITDEQWKKVHSLLKDFPGVHHRTRGGVRLIQRMSQELGPDAYEAMCKEWYPEVQALVGEVLEVDYQASDWTRLFRLPRVIRTLEDGSKLDLRKTRLFGTLKPVTIDPDDYLVVEGPPPKTRPQPIQLDDVDEAKRLERARNYLSKMPGAVSGENGHITTYLVARVLVWGFGLDESTALNLMECEFNPRCDPEWSTSDLKHKVSSANQPDKQGRARGYLLENNDWEPRERLTAPIESAGSMVIDNEDDEAQIQQFLKPTKKDESKPVKSSLVTEKSGEKASDTANEWTQHLKKKRGGGFKPTHQNCLKFFRNCPATKDKLAWDDFGQRVIFRESGRHWTDLDTTRVQIIMNNIDLDVPNEKTVQRTLALASRDHIVHPVKDYLENLEHDGVDRLDTWLETYLGADPKQYPSTYLAKIGRWWLIQAVRRIYEPGCPAKYILTLEGNQDIGKSHALRKLASPKWFSDSALSIGNKEGAMALHGKWLIEFAEAEIINRNSKEKVKQFVGQQSDNYIPKFLNEPMDVPRQAVFAMTVNPTGGEYLTDPTGNVRYWPLWCSSLDFDGLENDRDQLWAEAVNVYKAGEIPEPRTDEDKALLAEVVASRVSEDAWAGDIRACLQGRDETWIDEIMEYLDIPVKTRNQQDRNRIVRVLESMGFKKGKQGRREGKVRWLYTRMGTELQPDEEIEPADLSLSEKKHVDGLKADGWEVRVLPDGRHQLTQPTEKEDSHLFLCPDLGDI